MTIVKADTIGSLRVDDPKSAIDIQIPYDLNYFSDGQGYCYKMQEGSLPFLLSVDLFPMLPEIEIIEYNLHRVVNLKEKIKTPIDPEKSLVVNWYSDTQDIVLKHKQINQESLKFIHPLPLTILNTFSIKSINDIYKNSKDELLHDILDFILMPTINYILDKFPTTYFQGDEAAIFDIDIHGNLIDEEISIIGDLNNEFQMKKIQFSCYAPDLPFIPKNFSSKFDPFSIRKKILSIPNLLSWEFFYEDDIRNLFDTKLQRLLQFREYNSKLAIGIMDSVSENVDDYMRLLSITKIIVERLNLKELYITPIGGFKGIDPIIAEQKIKMLCTVRDEFV